MTETEVNKFRELLEKFDTAMLITLGDESPFHARPMAVAHVEPDCDLWFFTGRSSAKVHEIQNDQRVLVVCQDERRYLTLRGRARLILDRNKATEFWDPAFETWFPGGVSDSNLMLIRIEAEEAEYWDAGGIASVRHLFEAAKAYEQNADSKIRERPKHGTVSFDE